MYVSDLKTIVNEYTIKIYIPKMISVYNTKFLSKQNLQNPWYLLRNDEKEIHLSVHTCIEFRTLKDKPRELSLLLLMVIRGNFRD